MKCRWFSLPVSAVLLLCVLSGCGRHCPSGLLPHAPDLLSENTADAGLVPMAVTDQPQFLPTAFAVPEALPFLVQVSSSAELEALGALAADPVCWQEAAALYSDAFFDAHLLFLLQLEETNGAVGHEVYFSPDGILEVCYRMTDGMLPPADSASRLIFVPADADCRITGVRFGGSDIIFDTLYSPDALLSAQTAAAALTEEAAETAAP